MLLYVLRNLFGRGDEFDRQARIDQKSADFPYCKYGYMECRALCDCNPFLGGWAFRRARAATLRLKFQGLIVPESHVNDGNLQLPPRKE